MLIRGNKRGFNLLLAGMLLAFLALALCSLPWDKPMPHYASPVGYAVFALFAIYSDGRTRLRLSDDYGSTFRRLFSPSCGGHIMWIPFWFFGAAIFVFLCLVGLSRL